MNPIPAIVAAVLLCLAPLKPYVKPGEPINIRFAQTSVAEAQKLYDQLGPRIVSANDELTSLARSTNAAAQLPAANVFALPAPTDLFDAASKPLFHVYTLDGTALEAKTPAKPDLTTGVLDVAAYYPQLHDRGTYILTWKTAQPLIIETLGPAMPWGFLMDKDRSPQKEAIYQELKKSPPIITHIVPLTYALISTDKGDIKATFDYADAPHTVDTFVSLARQGYFDNSAFHRIIKGFMIQGGDSLATTPDRAGTGGPGFNQTAELSERPHIRGVLSMARTGIDVNTAGGQFFIIHGKADHLNGQYTVFGQVLAGMEVVDKIADTPVTDANGSVKPEDRPKIKSITILPATAEMYGIKAK